MENKGIIFFSFIYCLFIAKSYGNIVFQADTLKEVKVTGRKIPDNNKSINPVQSLKGDALERTNSLTVADAVRHLSGVQLKDYGGIGGLKTINVRNLGSLHTAIFYNGIQLGNAQNGQVDLGKFSLDNIESIELYQGQSNKQLLPARAYALANSLFLQSKSPYFKDVQRHALNASIRTGSFGFFNPSVTWHHKLNSRLYSSFSTEFQKAHGKYKFRYGNAITDSLIVRDNGYLDALRVEAGLYGINRDSSKWSLHAYTYNSKRGLPGAVVRNKFTSKQQLWDNDIFLQATFNKPVNEFYEFSLRAKYAYNYNRYLDPEWLNSTGKLENSYKQNEFYLSLANRYKVNSKFNLSLAADIIRNWMDAKIDASIEAFPQPIRLTGLIVFSSEFHVESFDLQATLLSTLVSESVKSGVSANNKSEFSPSISASWKPIESTNLRLRGFYKDSFRLPTFNDQYYTLIGNANLKPEYTKQYDLGFTYIKTLPYKFNYISLRTDLYYNQIRDKIVALPAKSLFLWTMMNIGEVQVKGLETGLSTEMILNPSLTVTAGLNYTYQHAIDVTPGGNSYNEFIPYAPEHAGSAAIGMVVKNYSLNYNYLYAGERYGLRPNNAESYMEPWYTHDISAGYKLTYKLATYKILAEVNNVFNQSYHVVRNYPMPGRSFRITLSMNY